MSDLRESLAGKAEEWAKAGVRFHETGIQRTGCSCWGLVVGCLRELGYLRAYPLPWTPARRSLNHNTLPIELSKLADQVNGRPARGDLICFAHRRLDELGHCGIAVGSLWKVHANNINNQVKTELLVDNRWEQLWRLSGSVWRLNEQKLSQFDGDGRWGNESASKSDIGKWRAMGCNDNEHVTT